MKDVLNTPEELAETLTLLCGKEHLQCEKQNASGIGWNKRFIIVKDNMFHYYRTSSSGIQQKNFKAKVPLKQIILLQFEPLKSKPKKQVVMSIPEKNIMLSDKHQIDPKNKKYVNWRFNFNFDVQEYILDKKADQAKQLERKKTDKIIIDLPPSDRDTEEKEEKMKEESVSDEYYPQQQGEEQLDRNVKKIKQFKRKIEFKETLDREEIQKKKRRRMRAQTSQQLKKQNEGEGNYPIENYWKEYHKTYEDTIKKSQQPLSKDKIKAEINLLNQISQFKVDSQNLARLYIDEKMIGWKKQQKIFDDFQFFKGVWIRSGGKQLNQIYLSNYLLADLLYEIKSFRGFQFRVPLMNLVKYKSFKVLVMSNMPFKNEVYNTKPESIDFDLEEYRLIEEALHYFSNIMGVQHEKYFNGRSVVECPLGRGVRVFRYAKVDHDSPQFIQKFYYLTGVVGIFPRDFIYQNKGRNCAFLRPELIAEYRDTLELSEQESFTLMHEAFTEFSHHPKLTNQREKDFLFTNRKEQEQRLALISLHFIPFKIKTLCKMINDVKIILTDSFTVKLYMSEMGINQRYLGKVCEGCTLTYAEEILKIQMVARVIKKLYRQSTADMINNGQLILRSQLPKNNKEFIKNRIQRSQQLLAQCAIDFLNLVFGNDQETESFWQIICQKVMETYSIKISYPVKLKAGCLLHSILWHCGLYIDFKIDIPLFKENKPFSLKNWDNFSCRSKCFDFPSFQFNKIIRKIPLVQDLHLENQKEYFLPLLKMELLFSHIFNRANFPTQVVLARINNLGEDFEKPLNLVPYHPTEISHYIMNRNPENFKKAVDLMSFALPNNHPLYISLYNKYSQQFDRDLLKKASLLASIQGLGQFHEKTTQMYSIYYRQGYKQFEVKANRSKNLQSALILSQQLFSQQKIQSCMQFTQQQIRVKNTYRFGSSNHVKMFFKILQNGILCSIKLNKFMNGLSMVDEYSSLINIYKPKESQLLEVHDFLLRNVMIITLCLSPHKLYLYKIVLLILKIQENQNDPPIYDDGYFARPRPHANRLEILTAILQEYYIYQTHSNWINSILRNLIRAYQYFNYVNDLFIDYQKHLKMYDNYEFEKSLGYFDVLIRYFGQRMFYQCLYESNVS